MTTIAYRDGVIAADTGCISGDTKLGHVIKIFRNDRGDLAAAAGDAAFAYAFHQWFCEGEAAPRPDAKEGENSFDRGVIFRCDGTIEVFEPSGKHVCMAEFYALGSGKYQAIGAMSAGADAITAVKAAMATDIYTFGEITVLRHVEEGVRAVV